MAKQPVGKKGKKAEASKVEGEVRFQEAFPAEVKELIGRGGSRGEITQVMCTVLDGRDKDKSIRRNVKGPVKVGDTLMLMDTEIEAQRIGRGGRRKKK